MHQRLDRGGRPRRTYKKALERFTHAYLPTLKPITQFRYRTSFRHLASTCANLYLHEISRGRLADYASARIKGGTKGATVRRDLAALSCLCSYAVAWDDIDANPVKQFSKRHIRASAPRTTELHAILGHKTVAMTMRYSHLMTDHLHRARNKYGTAIGTVPATGASDLAGKSSSDAR